MYSEEDLKNFTFKYFIESFKTNSNIPILSCDFSKGLVHAIRNGVKEIRPHYGMYTFNPIIILSYKNFHELEDEATAQTIFNHKIIGGNAISTIYGLGIIPMDIDDKDIFIVGNYSIHDYQIIRPELSLIIVDSKGEDKK